MTGGEEEPVLPRTAGRAAHIVLNRPRAFDALDHTMVRRIDEALTARTRPAPVGRPRLGLRP